MFTFKPYHLCRNCFFLKNYGTNKLSFFRPKVKGQQDDKGNRTTLKIFNADVVSKEEARRALGSTALFRTEHTSHHKNKI